MAPSRMEKGKETITVSSISDDADESWEWEDVRNIPLGYKFEPEDEELITYYLKPKLEHKELPPNFMHEIELYQPECPDLETLTARYEGPGEKWYFFTPRDRKYPNGRRPSRASGAGYWKATAACRDVRRSTGNKDLIGHKSSLVFYQGKPPGRKTNWLMQEFSLADHLITKTSSPAQDIITTTSRPQKRIKLDEWVLCKIYKNERNEKKHKSRGQASSINEEEGSHPVVEGHVQLGEGHNSGGGNASTMWVEFKSCSNNNNGYNKNKSHASGSSNALVAKQVNNNIGDNSNRASCNLMMQYTFPNPSEGLILKENYLTNDDGENANNDRTNNMTTFVGNTVEGALQENSNERVLGDIVQHPKRGGDKVVQEHQSSGSGAATVEDIFSCDSFLLETIDFSSLDSLEWFEGYLMDDFQDEKQ